MYSRDEMEEYASAHPPHDARAAAMIRQLLASEDRLQANLDRWSTIDEIMPPDYKDYWQARLDAGPTRLVTGGGGGTGC